MGRQSNSMTYITKPLAVDANLADAYVRFAELLGGEAFLLAFADDGVIWGRIKGGKLVTSHDVFPEVSPPLREITLQQAHLFNQKGEVRLWRAPEGLQAVHIEDKTSPEEDALDEFYLLWGTRLEKKGNNAFSLVTEGSRGFQHGVPLALQQEGFSDTEGKHLLRLHVRHYLAYDETGSAFIMLSRLVDLKGGQA